MDITKIPFDELDALKFHNGGEEYVFVNGFPVKKSTLKSINEATKREVVNILTKFDAGAGFGAHKIANDKQQVEIFIKNCQPFSSHRRVKVFLKQLRDLNKPGCRNPAIIGGKIKEICALLGNLQIKTKKVSSAPPKS